MFLQYKVLAGLMLFVLLIAGYEYKKHSFIEQGRAEIRAEWKKSNDAALIESAKINQLQVTINQAKARKAENEHTKQIAALDQKYRDDLAHIRSTGGLRIANIACHRQDTTAASTTKPDDTSATTRLPEQVENGLFDIAKDANTTDQRLIDLQQWIVDNGLGDLVIIQ